MLVEFLKQYLDSDTLGIVCEFLINGDDYASFTTLQDIKCIEARIYNWNDCMQWAARVSNFPILKYVYLIFLTLNIINIEIKSTF